MPVSVKAKVSSQISLHTFLATRRLIPEDLSQYTDHFTNLTLYNFCTTYIQYTYRNFHFMLKYFTVVIYSTGRCLTFWHLSFTFKF